MVLKRMQSLDLIAPLFCRRRVQYHNQEAVENPHENALQQVTPLCLRLHHAHCWYGQSSLCQCCSHCSQDQVGCRQEENQD